MHHSHTLPAPTRSRASRVVPLVVALLAAVAVVLVLAQVGDNDTASTVVTKTTVAAPGGRAYAARPDESGVAAAIASRPESGPSESRIAAALAGQRQLGSANDDAVTRKWQSYDNLMASQSQTNDGEPNGSLSQIKRNADYLRGH